MSIHQQYSGRNGRAGLVVRHALIGVGALVACSGLASGQTALGDGTGLDNNPGAFGRSNYARPSFAQELQFRNAVVTGNAPGGLSFRGDLGYRAAGEFTGSLGSDALFSFRRDSLYSGLAGMGIRGTDALQYQFSLTTGSRPPSNLVGDLSVARDRFVESSADQRGVNGLDRNRPGTIGFDPDSTDPRGLNLYRPSVQQADLADAITGTLRSSSTYTTTTNLSPVVLSVYYEGIERREYGLTSSPLTGLLSSPMKREEDPDLSRDPNMPRDPVGVKVRTAYDEVVERLRDRAARQAEASGDPTMGEDGSIAKQIQQMRLEMMGIDVPNPDAKPAGPGDEAGADPMNPGAQPSDPGSMIEDPTITDPERIDPARSVEGLDARTTPVDPTNPVSDTFGGRSREDQLSAYTVDESTLDLIRDRGLPIAALVDPNASSRDLYSEHMRTGERLISAERYFDAEERFARALAIRPGDQASQIGRAHAQLGAGLVISASVNLRQLLTGYPEIIGVRYAGKLLPAADRVDVLIDVLRERSGVSVREGEGVEHLSVRRSAAFLLAYLGYQNDRPEVITEGLGVLDEIGADDDRRFANVLRQVWLDADVQDGVDR